MRDDVIIPSVVWTLGRTFWYRISHQVHRRSVRPFFDQLSQQWFRHRIKEYEVSWFFERIEFVGDELL